MNSPGSILQARLLSSAGHAKRGAVAVFGVVRVSIHHEWIPRRLGETLRRRGLRRQGIRVPAAVVKVVRRASGSATAIYALIDDMAQGCAPVTLTELSEARVEPS